MQTNEGIHIKNGTLAFSNKQLRKGLTRFPSDKMRIISKMRYTKI